MDELRTRELVMLKLSEMTDGETVSDIEIAYSELKYLLRHYKNDLLVNVMYNGKETPENDN